MGWLEGHPRIFTVSPLVSNQPLICCSLGGIEVHPLIDTGSMKSFITRQIYEQLRLKQQLANNPQNAMALLVNAFRCRGQCELHCIFN